MKNYTIRFCIITEKNGDTFIDVLPEHINLSDAIGEIDWEFDHLSDYDKKVSTLTLTKLAVLSNGNVIDEEDDKSNEFYGYKLDGYDVFWRKQFDNSKYFWIIENLETLPYQVWEEAKEMIVDSLRNWDGANFHDEVNEYHDQIFIEGKTIAFKLEAKTTEDGLDLGNIIEIKRVR